jgi:hypothetical protein
MADSNGAGDGGPSEDQLASARSILGSVMDDATPGGSVPFTSTEFGPGGGKLGFGYRSGSLMTEYQDDANAADAHPDPTLAASDLMELDDHTPLSDAGTEYAAVERTVLELTADTVTGTPNPESLEPVTVWPVSNEPGLYRVGFEVPSREFLYAVAFKIPPAAFE